MFYRRSSGLCVVAAVLLVAGCGKDPEVAKREHLQRGDAYTSQKKFPEAIIEYRNAIQLDPHFGEARKKLADVYATTGELGPALGEYVRAADTLEEDLEAQLKAGEMLLMARRFEDAEARAQRALALAPRNTEALILRANALAGLKKLDEAVRELESAIEAEPEKGDSYANLGFIQMARGDAKLAEAAFKKAVETDPRSVSARLSLANYYWAARRHADAEAELKSALALDKNEPLANRALAIFYMANGRGVEAEPHLKVLATLSGQGQLALADYYVKARRAPEARAVLDQVVNADPIHMPAAKLRLARLDMSGGDKATAVRLIEEVLATHPSYVEALVAKAGVLAEDRQHDAALEFLKRAEEVDPRMPAVHFARGKLHLLRGETGDALAAFNEVIKLNPRNGAAQLELARLHFSAGRLDAAYEFIQNAVQNSPTSFEARLLYARINRMKGNTAAAESALKVLAARAPDSPDVQTERALIDLARNSRGAARAGLEKVLEKNPAHSDAVVALAVMDAQDKQPDAAKARLKEALQRNPKDVALLLFAGGMHSSLQEFDAAERLFRQAIEVDSNNMNAYGMLGHLYARRGELDKAITEFERVAARDTTSVPAHTMVGVLLEKAKRVADAQVKYEHILSIDPQAAVAANNLAWIYAERGEKLDVALDLAQTAKSKLPENADVNDTLGWIYHKKGLGLQAVSALQEAVAKDPRNPLFLYHLGMAQEARGNYPEARAALEKALGLAADFSGAEEARLTLAKLR